MTRKLSVGTVLPQMQGHANGQFHLGLMYGYGRGVPQDYSEAFRWYRLAAEQGHAGAQHNLGVAYDDGAGVPQDYSEAFRWYRLAAEQGIATAHFNLGRMYAYGQGVPQDYIEAHMWLNLAASRLSGENRERAVTTRPRSRGDDAGGPQRSATPRAGVARDASATLTKMRGGQAQMCGQRMNCHEDKTCGGRYISRQPRYAPTHPAHRHSFLVHMLTPVPCGARSCRPCFAVPFKHHLTHRAQGKACFPCNPCRCRSRPATEAVAEGPRGPTVAVDELVRYALRTPGLAADVDVAPAAAARARRRSSDGDLQAVRNRRG